jgi:low temperature requirement protein LtrA
VFAKLGISSRRQLRETLPRTGRAEIPAWTVRLLSEDRRVKVSERLLRRHDQGAAEVRPIELFFDLVYVLAITQLTQYLLEHLSLRGAAETLLLLLVVWAAWNYTSWVTNYFDPGTRPVQLMLLAVMLASLIMSASVPQAFGDRGLAFAAALVVIQVGRTTFAVVVLGREHHLFPVFERALVWWSLTGLLWLAGGLLGGDLRLALWAVAVVVEYGAVWRGFPVLGLGHAATTDYTIAGGHMAERCQQFVILALGESIVITGANLGQRPNSAATVGAFVVAFVGSVALWWIYFDRAAEAGRRVIAAATDPGRLGVSAYTYFHIPMVAGIIVAAGADELVIAHRTEEATLASTALILGGPALYLAGSAIFKMALWQEVPWSRPVAILALGALIPLALVSSALVLLAAATLVLVGVALWDIHIEGG